MCCTIYCSVSSETSAQVTFSTRLHFDRPSIVLTGVETVSDGYWVNGISAWPTPPYRIGNLMAKFSLDGELLQYVILEDSIKTHEVWRSGLQRESDSTLLSVGYTLYGEGPHILLIRYNTMGEVIDLVEYENSFFPDYLSSPRGLVRSDDNWLVCGTGRSDGVLNFVHILLLDGNDEPVWERAYDFSNDLNEIALSAITTSDGSFVVGGRRDDIPFTSIQYDARTYLIGIDGTTGLQTWDWLSPEDQLQAGANGMITTPDKGLVVATAIGDEQWVNPGNSNILWDNYIFKLDSTREVTWGTYFRETSTKYNHFRQLIACSDGSGFVAIGSQNKFYGGTDIHEENTFDQGGYIVKVSPEGDSLWSRVIVHPNDVSYADQHDLYEIEETPDGGFICVGQSIDLFQSPQFQQGWLLKVDEYGCLVPGCHLISSTKAPEGPDLRLLLYPNPASDVLNVYIGPGTLSPGTLLRLIDSAGREVHHRRIAIDDATYILDLSHFAGGTYYIHLADEWGQALSTPQAFVIVR